MQAFDHLLSLELLVPVVGGGVGELPSGGGGGGGRHQQLRQYMSVQLVLSRDQITKAIEEYPHCPTDLIRWASSQATVM